MYQKQLYLSAFSPTSSDTSPERDQLDALENPKTQPIRDPAHRPIVECLQMNSFLSDIPEHILFEIARYLYPLPYRRAEFVFRQGQEAEVCFIVASGLIACRDEKTDSLQALLSKGHAYGLLQTINRTTYSCNAVCSTDCELLTLSRRDALRLVARYPVIRSAAISIIGQQLRQSLDLQHAFLQQDPRVRISRVLCCLGPDSLSRDKYELAISIEELSSIAGTSLSETTETCKRLVRDSLIWLDEAAVVVLSREALSEYAADT